MSVTICIPTYNRKKFEKLIEHNINTQTYYNIREILILDDSDIDEPLCIKTKYPIRYYRVPRCSIGDKRNALVQLTNTEYVAFMDTDDFYSDYIAYSIFEMETNHKSIAGSADMIVYSEGSFYKQRCLFLHMLNEATLVFKKSVNPVFASSNNNEAVPFLSLNLKNIIETNIDRVMSCVSHNSNTISKSQWIQDKLKIEHLSQYKEHQKILCGLNI